MQDLLGKIKVVLDPKIPGRFEDMHIDLKVVLDTGQTLEQRCNGPRGKWGTTPISEAEHLVKVRDCLATRLDTKTSARLIDQARKIDDLDASGIHQLMELAGCFPKSK